ncbi:hypothetical protein CC86DRAFT_369433 [Ophiobolus disseminans]|uniref:GroES-like protein n=1 Tax=Ophiobolus disseminans TaxID=1469910 RepID=A0A6A7A3W5_9PLEO|nr:hypothetical protein CC86DRAFT_369433 [Ophiobolus disseminans]
MSPPPTKIHVLDKANYSNHRLVSLQDTTPTTLPPSSLRLRPKILGLTTNNLTYARHGHLMGWYDIYPLPPSTPAPYNDAQTYGRVAAWGYAEIVESSVLGINRGQAVYGFLPISSGLETVCVESAEHGGMKIKNQLVVLDAHRQHLWQIYNRYTIFPSLPTLIASRGADALGWDALMQGLFATGYNLSTFGFAWQDERRIHPSGKGEWGQENADLKGAAVVLLNASGKTGLGFAWAVRRARPNAEQPERVIGVGSEVSVDAIRKSGMCDEVYLNSEDEVVKEVVEKSQCRRIVLLDFGAREGVAEKWSSTLSSSSIPFSQITVGGEVKVQNPETARKRLALLGKTVLVNASLLREKGIEVGGEKYFEAFFEAWEEYKKDISSMKLQWGTGLEAWEKGWEALCRDEVRADTGLVYNV